MHPLPFPVVVACFALKTCKTPGAPCVPGKHWTTTTTTSNSGLHFLFKSKKSDATLQESAHLHNWDGTVFSGSQLKEPLVLQKAELRGLDSLEPPRP